jgi:Zn-finger nucleic acid-binding protein
MQCPVCKKHTLNAVELAPGLSGVRCSECSGTWIPRSKYDEWRAKQPGDLPETNAPAQAGVTGPHKAKICPQCGHLLLPYRVGHGLSFSIDYCGSCGGVWLDGSEWDAVKARNLHDNLHDMVSAHWQAAVRQADVQAAVEQAYSRHLGIAYGKAAEVRAWLQSQPQKALILAYLSGAKPEGQ